MQSSQDQFTALVFFLWLYNARKGDGPLFAVPGENVFFNISITISTLDSSFIALERSQDERHKLMVFLDRINPPEIAGSYRARIKYTGNIGRGEISFWLYNVSMEDAGEFRVVPVGIRIVYGSQLLAVAGRPDNPIIVERTVPQVNKDHVLECKTHSNSRPENNGFKMSFIWKLNDTNLENNSNYTGEGQILRIHNLQRGARFDNYTCVAYDSPQLRSNASDYYQMDPKYGPSEEMSLDPSNRTYFVEAGFEIRNITCSADCHPDCIYTWDRGFRQGAKLLLGVTDVGEAGIYSCTARNPITNVSLSTSFEVILVTRNNCSCLLGTCGVELCSSSRFTSATSTEIREISTTHEYENDGHDYSGNNCSCLLGTCGVELCSSSTFTPVQTAESRQISSTHKNRNNGHDHFFECQVATETISFTGGSIHSVNVLRDCSLLPNVSVLGVTWFKENTSIAKVSNSKFTPCSSYIGRLERFGTFQISLHNLSVNDSGHYNMSVLLKYNIIDTSSADTTCQTTYLPGRPDNPTIVERTIPQVNKDHVLECKTKSNSRPETNGFKMNFIWQRNDTILANNAIQTVQGQTLSIHRLQREDRFDKYTCIAFDNQKLKSNGSNYHQIDPKYGPSKELTLDPSNRTYFVEEGFEMRNIICSADCHPDCIYTWDNGVRQGELLSLGVIDEHKRGIYRCTAQNPITNVSLTISVEVILTSRNNCSCLLGTCQVDMCSSSTITPSHNAKGGSCSDEPCPNEHYDTKTEGKKEFPVAIVSAVGGATFACMNLVIVLLCCRYYRIRLLKSSTTASIPQDSNVNFSPREGQESEEVLDDEDTYSTIDDVFSTERVPSAEMTLKSESFRKKRTTVRYTRQTSVSSRRTSSTADSGIEEEIETP